MTKEARTYNGVMTVYSISGIGIIRQIHAKNETSLTYIRIKSKWIKDLNVKLETIKLQIENIGEKSLTFPLAIFFSDVCPLARETPATTTNKWDHIKL